MRDTTLVFLVKKNESEISEICLAMKKRGFGVGRWNGVGGKTNPDESIIDAAKREAYEEIGINFEEAKQVAELFFYFPHQPEWDQRVTVYFVEKWTGEPTESEEMMPKWFSPNELPFDSMWPDDRFWIPEVIADKLVRAKFVFGEGDVVAEQKVEIVENI